MHKLSAKETSPHLVIKPTFDGIQKVKRNLPPGVARSLVVKTRLYIQLPTVAEHLP